MGFTGLPFGFGVPIVYACISWGIAWLALVHLIWNLGHFSRVGNLFKSVVAVLATIVGSYILISPIHQAYVKEKARATSGDLIAKDDGKDHSSEPPILQIGPTGGSRLAWTGPQDTPMISAYYDRIAIRMVKGRAYLSTTVRDQNKNLIVEIVDNHWTVSSSTAVCWDKNFTGDSLEVKDGHGRVVLQVKVMPNMIQLQEEWEWDLGTKSGGIFEDGQYDVKTGIKPVFRYPSELYWGQLEGSQY